MKLHSSGHIKSRGNFLNLTCPFYDKQWKRITEDWIFQCDLILHYLQDYFYVECMYFIESVFILSFLNPMQS